MIRVFLLLPIPNHQPLSARLIGFGPGVTAIPSSKGESPSSFPSVPPTMFLSWCPAHIPCSEVSLHGSRAPHAALFFHALLKNESPSPLPPDPSGSFLFFLAAWHIPGSSRVFSILQPTLLFSFIFLTSSICFTCQRFDLTSSFNYSFLSLPCQVCPHKV